MLKRLVYSFGFATLFLFSSVVEIAGSAGTTIMDSPLVLTSEWAALLLDTMLLTFAVAAVWWLGARRKSWRRVRVALAILLPMLALAGNRLLAANWWFRTLRASQVPPLERAGLRDLMSPVPYWLMALILVAWALVVAWMNSHSEQSRRVLLIAGKIGLLSGVVLGVNLGLNLARAAVRSSREDRLALMHTRDSQEQSEHPRLVWVVMDELSYWQAFEHRVPDLQMPNFDALRSQSVLYTHVQPVAYWTELAVTSMLVGEALDDDRESYGGTVRFRDADQETWRRWDPQATLLGDAERAQWNVAVSGWWSPYCTLFRGMLQSCFWSDANPYSPTRPWYSIRRNMRNTFVSPLRPRLQPPALRMRMHENYLLLSKGLADIGDDKIDFVFLHLPVPHYPFVFDRHTGQDDPRSGHSYQDGLALADRMLGQIMTVAQQSPRWHNTTFILDGDHSWRTNMWVSEAGWTPEDEITSDGAKFDDRPVMMVHAPGQTSPVTVDQATPLLHVHDIVESVIKQGKPALP